MFRKYVVWGILIVVFALGALQGFGMLAMHKALIIFVLFVVTVAFGFLGKRFERTSRQEMLQDRADLSDDQIYQQFYLSSGIPKCKILDSWHDLADLLHVDSGRLRPDDRIIDLKGLVVTLESDIEDLAIEIGSRARRNSPKPDDLETVDGVVRYFALLQ